MRRIGRSLLLLTICLALGVSTATSVLAQSPSLSWLPCEEINATLPPAVKLYESRMPAIPLCAWYVSYDLQDQNLQFKALLSQDGDGRETVTEFAAAEKALVAMNAGYFAINGNKAVSVSLVMVEGQILASNVESVNKNGLVYYPTRSAFALLTNNSPDVAWVYPVSGVTYAYINPSPIKVLQPQPQPTAAFPIGGLPWPATMAVGGGPVLVHDNKAKVTWEEEVMFWSGTIPPPERHPRSAIGYTADNHVIMLVIDGRYSGSRGVSLQELADIMVSLDCVEALNLDGGGSSALVVMQKLINRPEGGTFQRQVTSAVAVTYNNGKR